MHGAKHALHFALSMECLLNSRESNLDQWPPLKLLKAACAGALLIASGFLWVVLHGLFLRLHVYYFGPRLGLLALSASICLLVSPVLIGASLIALAWWWLSDGLTRIKWTESEIEAARAWAESHRLSRTANWLLASFVIGEIIVSYLIFHVWKISHHTETKIFFDSLTLLCIPSLVVSETADQLLREAPRSHSGEAKRHSGFHSEHWGERKPLDPK